MLKAFDRRPQIKDITIKLYYCKSCFNWWFKFRFIWSQRNCCISYFHFPPLQNHHSNRNMCQHCTMLILNPQNLNSCCKSHEGLHSNAALIILETIWSSLPSSLSAPQLACLLQRQDLYVCLMTRKWKKIWIVLLLSHPNSGDSRSN